MTTARTTLTRWGNTLGVWLYCRSDGRLAGPGKGTTIGLLTVPGRTTGIPRTVVIGFFPHGTGYLVAGSASGARRDPQWFRNLRAAPHAHIQIGAARMDADVRIAETAERDLLWQQVILAQAPWRRRYEKKGRPDHPRRRAHAPATLAMTNPVTVAADRLTHGTAVVPVWDATARRLPGRL